MTEDNGCKVELTIGESNPVPGPRRPMANGLEFPGLLPPADGTSGRCFLLTDQGLCMDNFGNETALLFGAYRGAAGLQDSYLDGFESSLALCCVSVAACLLVLALAFTCADDTPAPSGKPPSGVRVRRAVLAKRQA